MFVAGSRFRMGRRWPALLAGLMVGASPAMAAPLAFEPAFAFLASEGEVRYLEHVETDDWSEEDLRNLLRQVYQASAQDRTLGPAFWTLSAALRGRAVQRQAALQTTTTFENLGWAPAPAEGQPHSPQGGEAPAGPQASQ